MIYTNQGSNFILNCCSICLNWNDIVIRNIECFFYSKRVTNWSTGINPCTSAISRSQNLSNVHTFTFIYRRFLQTTTHLFIYYIKNLYNCQWWFTLITLLIFFITNPSSVVIQTTLSNEIPNVIHLTAVIDSCTLAKPYSKKN